MIINIVASDSEKSKAILQADAWANQLVAATPQQISTWVDNNINTLADAKKLFKFILLKLKTM